MLIDVCVTSSRYPAVENKDNWQNQILFVFNEFSLNENIKYSPKLTV